MHLAPLKQACEDAGSREVLERDLLAQLGLLMSGRVADHHVRSGRELSKTVEHRGDVAVVRRTGQRRRGLPGSGSVFANACCHREVSGASFRPVSYFI